MTTQQIDIAQIVQQPDIARLSALAGAGGAALIGGSLLRVANVTAARALTAATDGSVLFIDGKDGGLFRRDSTDTTSVENGASFCGTIIRDTTYATAGVWKRVYDAEVDPRWFGAALDGVATDDTPVSSALAVGDTVISSGTALIDNITMSTARRRLRVARGATLKLKTPAVAFTTGVTVSANDCSVLIEGTLDINSTTRTGIDVGADRVTVDVEEIVNGTADVDSGGSVSGVRFNSGVDGYCIIRKGRNFTNTGNTNGSTPRLLSVQGTTDRFHCSLVKGFNIGGSTVVTAGSGAMVFGTIDTEDCADNGLYNFGTNVTVDKIIYRGNEEAVINAGGLNLGTLELRDSVVSGLGLQSANYTQVDNISIVPGASSAVTPLSIMRTRADNVASGPVTIGRVTGRLRGSSLFQLSTGTVSRLDLGDWDVDYEYDAGVSGVITSWAVMTGVQQYNVNDIRVRIIDVNNVLTGANIFQWQFPTSVVADSFIKDIRIGLVNADETTASAATLRMTSIAVARVMLDGIIIQDVAGTIYGKEYVIGAAQYGAAGNVILGTAAPTGGHWKQGTDLVLANKAAAPFRARCTVTGTPGTWVLY
jgi:hypothetical protein